jgi:hypothetical protein
MCQGHAMASKKFDHRFGLDFLSIFCYNISREAEHGKDIGFKKIHNHLVNSIPSGNNLNQFGKVVNGSEDPLVILTRRCIYFTYEI